MQISLPWACHWLRVPRPTMTKPNAGKRPRALSFYVPSSFAPAASQNLQRKPYRNRLTATNPTPCSSVLATKP